jgi:L-Ala-D/L-Glu epimerase / N-acetyl-D-glutamate racemase
MPAVKIEIAKETWPLAGAFVISRGAKTEAHVVTVTLRRGDAVGRGECVPYARYGETLDGVVQTLQDAGTIQSRHDLASALPPGAARNALDCAYWDLEAKEAKRSVAAALGLAPTHTLETCYTVSLGTPDAMAAEARSVPNLKILKLKLGGAGDIDRMRAVRQARPEARLVADANESWSPVMLSPYLAASADANIELIEQPLPADADAPLSTISHAVPICADESAHTHRDLASLAGRYDAVNIKLDKTGGLTEALTMAAAAREQGLRIMAGCMVATSLSMAPAFLLAQNADWVDLDGPLLLAKDRPDGLRIRDGIIEGPSPKLWG